MLVKWHTVPLKAQRSRQIVIYLWKLSWCVFFCFGVYRKMKGNRVVEKYYDIYIPQNKLSGHDGMELRIQIGFQFLFSLLLIYVLMGTRLEYILWITSSDIILETSIFIPDSGVYSIANVKIIQWSKSIYWHLVLHICVNKLVIWKWLDT